MIDAQQVEHGGVQVVDHEFLLDHAVAIVIGGPDNGTPLHPATSQPE